MLEAGAGTHGQRQHETVRAAPDGGLAASNVPHPSDSRLLTRLPRTGYYQATQGVPPITRPGMVTMLAAAPDSEPAAPAGPQWVVLLCDDVRLAVPLVRVHEILTPRPFTRLPGCGPEVCGLIGVRGRVSTVFDVGILLGRARSSEVPDHRLLLLEWRGRRVGLAVDAIDRIVPAETTPDDSHGLPLQAGEVIGIGAVDNERFVALDPDHLLDRLLPGAAPS